MNTDMHTEFKLFLNKRLPDIHRKLDRAEKLSLECDPHIVNVLSEISTLLEENKKFKAAREYTVVNNDFEIIKNDYIKGCKCKRVRLV